MKKRKIGLYVLAVWIGAISSLADGGTVFGKLAGQVLATRNGGIVIFDSTGKDLWSHQGGNCHDVWMLKNGHILFADGIIHEIDPKTDEEVFTYSPEVTEGGGAYTCQRLKNGNTLVGENATGRILEVTPAGDITFELKTEFYKPGSHQNLRMVRKLNNGNYLVCHSGKHIVREYTPQGKPVFEVTVPNIAFSAVRLPTGNTLVGNLDAVTEFDPKGRKTWELSKADLQEIELGSMCGLNVLPNGNLLIGIYHADQTGNGAALMEVTRDKKIIWRYVDLNKTKGHMMSAQKLSTEGKALSDLR